MSQRFRLPATASDLAQRELMGGALRSRNKQEAWRPGTGTPAGTRPGNAHVPPCLPGCKDAALPSAPPCLACSRFKVLGKSAGMAQLRPRLPPAVLGARKVSKVEGNGGGGGTQRATVVAIRMGGVGGLDAG